SLIISLRPQHHTFFDFVRIRVPSDFRRASARSFHSLGSRNERERYFSGEDSIGRALSLRIGLLSPIAGRGMQAGVKWDLRTFASSSEGLFSMLRQSRSMNVSKVSIGT